MGTQATAAEVSLGPLRAVKQPPLGVLTLIPVSKAANTGAVTLRLANQTAHPSKPSQAVLGILNQLRLSSLRSRSQSIPTASS